jgi:hypothetical protein
LCRGVSLGGDDFEKGCNHLIQEHGMKCLHVGQESDEGDDGLWHFTVAVFGK